MRTPGIVSDPAYRRPFLAEAAQRLEQAISMIRRAYDERSVDQPRQLIEDVPIVGIRADHGDGIGEGESSREHCDTFEARPLLVVEELV